MSNPKFVFVNPKWICKVEVPMADYEITVERKKDIVDAMHRFASKMEDNMQDELPGPLFEKWGWDWDYLGTTEGETTLNLFYDCLYDALIAMFVGGDKLSQEQLDGINEFLNLQKEE